MKAYSSFLCWKLDFKKIDTSSFSWFGLCYMHLTRLAWNFRCRVGAWPNYLMNWLSKPCDKTLGLCRKKSFFKIIFITRSGVCNLTKLLYANSEKARREGEKEKRWTHFSYHNIKGCVVTTKHSISENKKLKTLHYGGYSTTMQHALTMRLKYKNNAELKKPFSENFVI